MSSGKTYLARRTLLMITTLFCLSIVVFASLRIAPGDPVTILLEQRRSELEPLEVQRLRSKIGQDLGLDRPFLSQYGAWVARTLHGDLGRSLADQSPVVEKIRLRLPRTIALNALALSMALLLALPLGIGCGLIEGSLLDQSILQLLDTAWALPLFWLALALQRLFVVRLGWLPMFPATAALGQPWCMESLRFLILPAAILALGTGARLTRTIRQAVAEARRAPHIRQARVRGLGWAAVQRRYLLRQALVPLTPVAATLAAQLVAGSIVIESIFGWPGVGSLAINAVLARDYPVVQALALLAGLIVLAATLASDGLLILVDPRIRYGRSRL